MTISRPGGDSGIAKAVLYLRVSTKDQAKKGGEEEGFSIFLLYGDHEGGQRTISRFGLRAHEEEGRWFCSVTRHWSLEGPDPRADAH